MASFTGQDNVVYAGCIVIFTHATNGALPVDQQPWVSVGPEQQSSSVEYFFSLERRRRGLGSLERVRSAASP